MPPQASSSYRPVSNRTPLLAPASPKSRFTLSRDQKFYQRMNLTKKKLIPTLVFVLAGVSLLQLLRITVTTSSPPAAIPPALLHVCSSPSPACRKTTPSQPLSFPNASTLTEKEFHFISNLISRKAPCNLLVFGLEQQYLAASSFNAGGTTIFLEDNPQKISKIKTNSNNTQVYQIVYKTPAKEAYKLLKHARKNQGCSPYLGKHKVPRCKLALTDLPKEVFELKWDVVVVDGPTGNGPEAPGRMEAIYTASILARRGRMTEVLVHDIDRMIEKWFSWEFMCDENLISSKGKFWNFRIARQTNSTTFCNT